MKTVLNHGLFRFITTVFLVSIIMVNIGASGLYTNWLAGMLPLYFVAHLITRNFIDSKPLRVFLCLTVAIFVTPLVFPDLSLGYPKQVISYVLASVFIIMGVIMDTTIQAFVNKLLPTK
ncbi:hypothetical protein FR932_00060 (plasmid) [Moritella marina ATCC 15381]|uniref:Uncharacterized protein n=1 Tax=Moritella marina ATCC 15381 TaxID=1202962 RepID=A0A5J6WEP6_MORMI|nr:hypothetical protein [Moritella marina]QFI36319.1 hypothetical protein FR932_00060 [Moritella marina ATCC 15381]